MAGCKWRTQQRIMHVAKTDSVIKCVHHVLPPHKT